MERQKRQYCKRRIRKPATYPIARYFPLRSPWIIRLPNPPSSCHRLVDFLSATSHTYTSPLSLNPINSLPSFFPPFAHHIDYTPAFIFRLPTTCPAPDFQSTRCT